MHLYLTPEPITCEVRNAAGAVIVDLSDTSRTTVEVHAVDQPTGVLDDIIRSVSGWAATPGSGIGGDTEGDAAGDVTVSFENGRLIVDTEAASQRTGFVVRICAPSGSGVRTRTGSAGVDIEGSADRIEIKTADGAVRIGVAAGNIMVRTVSGDIAVRDAHRGTVDLAAVSGSLHVGVHPGVAARVDLTTVSGAARSTLPVVDRIEGSTLTIRGRTVSGTVSLASSDADQTGG